MHKNKTEHSQKFQTSTQSIINYKAWRHGQNKRLVTQNLEQIINKTTLEKANICQMCSISNAFRKSFEFGWLTAFTITTYKIKLIIPKYSSTRMFINESLYNPFVVDFIESIKNSDS